MNNNNRNVVEVDGLVHVLVPVDGEPRLFAVESPDMGQIGFIKHVVHGGLPICEAMDRDRQYLPGRFVYMTDEQCVRAIRTNTMRVAPVVDESSSLPPCPDCHGRGWKPVSLWITNEDGEVEEDQDFEPCTCEKGRAISPDYWPEVA